MQNVPCACLICWCSLIHRIFSFNRMLLTTIEKFAKKNASSWTIISSDIIWRFQMPWHHSKSTCAHFWSILVGWNQKRSYPIQFECVASANQSRLLLEIKSQALLFTLHLFLTSSHTTFFGFVYHNFPPQTVFIPRNKLLALSVYRKHVTQRQSTHLQCRLRDVKRNWIWNATINKYSIVMWNV